jgi:hypothetical protein
MEVEQNPQNMHASCFFRIVRNRSLFLACSNNEKFRSYMRMNVCFTSFDMGVFDFQEILRESSVGIIPVFMQYLMKFSPVAIS